MTTVDGEVEVTLFTIETEFVQEDKLVSFGVAFRDLAIHMRGEEEEEREANEEDREECLGSHLVKRAATPPGTACE